MKTSAAYDAVRPVLDRATREGDACLFVYFSREEDEFIGDNVGMDAGDALVVIRRLASLYDLSPEGVAAVVNGAVIADSAEELTS